jgi:uncharacterized protein
MKIRSITMFINPGWPLQEEALNNAEVFLAAAKPAFTSAGYDVQTTRLATVPFPTLLSNFKPEAAAHFAQEFGAAAQSLGYDYISLGPALPAYPQSYAAIPEMLAAAGNVFACGLMASIENGVSLPAVRACAEVIHRAASLSSDGFGNLRFAALANVPPGSPFFPAAYHQGDRSAFAIATESADLAVDAFTEVANLDDARQRLVLAVEAHAQTLSDVAELLAGQFELSFGGIDFSLAPFPEEARSLGAAMERLGVPALGMHGSLAAAAILADTLDLAQFRRAGFNGLMLPVLEDSVLAKRAAEGTLSVSDLLLYSAVCGTGLDTLPLPGDTTSDQLAALLLDLAALAQRLGKPLTARLMPIPGKNAGELTGFDFPYFRNSRVLSLKSLPLKGLLSGDGAFALSPRISAGE